MATLNTYRFGRFQPVVLRPIGMIAPRGPRRACSTEYEGR
jgi:hypothetical protein